jgi:hypothetical protein
MVKVFSLAAALQQRAILRNGGRFLAMGESLPVSNAAVGQAGLERRGAV